MKRRVGPAAAGIAVLALLALLIYGLAKQGPSRALDRAVEAGREPAAPSTAQALPVLDGVAAPRASLERWRGGVVVLNFWASWCASCAVEEPLLERTQRMLAAAHEGTVVGITYQDVASSSLGAIRHYRLSFPNLRDVSGAFAASYGTAQLPETFVLGRRLQVVAISRGPIESASWLDRAIARAARA